MSDMLTNTISVYAKQVPTNDVNILDKWLVKPPTSEMLQNSNTPVTAYDEEDAFFAQTLCAKKPNTAPTFSY